MNKNTSFLNRKVLVLLTLVLLVACNQISKNKTSRPDVKARTNKIIEPVRLDKDSILLRIGYPEVKSFDELHESYSDYTEREKYYFKGKINLTESYIRHNLFSGIDSVACADCNSKIPLTEYLTQYDFYLMRSTIKNRNFKAIIYEELGQDGSHKYLSTINKNGKFISRIEIAGYYQQETYFDKNGERQAFYVELEGYVTKNLNINVTSDYQGIEKAFYIIHPDGRIVKK